jgi:Holliday junction resolvasome RuvABC endonuclease subunit
VDLFGVMKMNLLAIDQSLNETGICYFRDGNFIASGTIKPNCKGAARLAFIISELDFIVDNNEIEEAVIENYSFGSRGRSTFSIGELGGVLRHYFFIKKIPLTIIATTSMKKFVSGDGHAEKDMMLKTVLTHFKFDTNNANIADAFGLGQFKLALDRYKAKNIDGLTQYQIESLDKYIESHQDEEVL